jgi:hypothetical protein
MHGGGHGGMNMQGGMQHEGGMSGCKMMGGDHAGTKHDGKESAEAQSPEAKADMMRNMMHGMMAEMAARADARLAALKTELTITDAQLPQWNAFADAIRAAARSMEEAHKDKMAAEAAVRAPAPKPVTAAEPSPGGDTDYPDKAAVKKLVPPAPAPGHAAGSLPAKLDAHVKMMSRHLESFKAIVGAVDKLYVTLDDQQKAKADGLKIGPMGLM